MARPAPGEGGGLVPGSPPAEALGHLVDRLHGALGRGGQDEDRAGDRNLSWCALAHSRGDPKVWLAKQVPVLTTLLVPRCRPVLGRRGVFRATVTRSTLPCLASSPGAQLNPAEPSGQANQRSSQARPMTAADGHGRVRS